MSGPLEAVQAALVILLDGTVALYDGAPPRAAFPYVVIGDSPVTDWSTKTERGREIRLVLNIWDDGEEAESLRGLMIAVEAAMDGFPRDLPGWRVASLVFLRSRVNRDPAGPSAALIEYRIRVLER
ncbi:MAG: DUF3168 domain-containing protein [Pseudomonadota bacterium]